MSLDTTPHPGDEHGLAVPDPMPGGEAPDEGSVEAAGSLQVVEVLRWWRRSGAWRGPRGARSGVVAVRSSRVRGAVRGGRRRTARRCWAWRSAPRRPGPCPRAGVREAGRGWVSKHEGQVSFPIGMRRNQHQMLEHEHGVNYGTAPAPVVTLSPLGHPLMAIRARLSGLSLRRLLIHDRRGGSVSSVGGRCLPLTRLPAYKSPLRSHLPLWSLRSPSSG